MYSSKLIHIPLARLQVRDACRYTMDHSGTCNVRAIVALAADLAGNEQSLIIIISPSRLIDSRLFVSKGLETFIAAPPPWTSLMSESRLSNHSCHCQLIKVGSVLSVVSA